MEVLYLVGPTMSREGGRGEREGRGRGGGGEEGGEGAKKEGGGG